VSLELAAAVTRLNRHKAAKGKAEALAGAKASLEETIAVLEAQRLVLGAEEARLLEESRALLRAEVETYELRSEVERAELIARRIGEELDILSIERHAPSRLGMVDPA
jgi:hypothetical protein